MGLTYKEVGQLTLRKFNKLYQHYKNTFDIELTLYLSKTTYDGAMEKAIQDEEWF